MSFHDHFSARAAGYARYRPRYPAALTAWVAALAPTRERAWDCATGSGQAAVGLAAHIARVVATDASAAQLAHAARHAGVDYCVARAEDSALATGSVGLVTVAQALHWLDLTAFYAEVRRVLAPGGALAVWSYGDPVLGDAALDHVLQRYARETVGAYWAPERRMVDEGYRGIPFPFREVAAPRFALAQRWTLSQLAGYLRTWSATARYAAALGGDPVVEVEAALGERWGGAAARRWVRWPVAVRAGYA